MDLIKLFQDEALIEILGFASMSISYEDNHIQIFVVPINKIEITRMQMEDILSFFEDYYVYLNLIGDEPFFVIEDWPKEDEAKNE